MGYTTHIVSQGDCIASIAFEYGFFPDTIWNDPKNSKLKQDRKNPNVLLPGDEVYIRDKEAKEESCGSDKRHRFKRKGVPEKLQLVLLDAERKPIANEPVVVDIDGVLQEIKTDGEGKITVSIPPNARNARLAPRNRGEEHEVPLGYVDPVDTTSGLQTRLNNLGYACPVSGELDDQTREAVTAFQAEYKLKATGEFDEATKAKIKEVYEG